MSEPVDFVPTYLRCVGGPNHDRVEDVTTLVRPARIGVGTPYGAGCDGEYVEDSRMGVLVWQRRTWRWHWRVRLAQLRLWWRRFA